VAGTHNAAAAAVASQRMMSTFTYTASHEWVSVDGDIATVGITDYAQDALGEIVYVEFPEIGEEVDLGDTFGAVESVKAASELYAPIGGEIVEINEALDDADGDPGLLNTSPMEAGWIIKIKIENPAEIDGMMDQATYDAMINDE